jgi:very-short-patch-repair endonuclease
MPLKNFTDAKHRTYVDKIKSLAKTNRQSMTDAERIFWAQLRNKIKEFKFRRQFTIDNKYIVDFVCLEKRLIIEIDGGQHNDNLKDLERTKYLEKEKFIVMRFWNNEVLNNLQACLDAVYTQLRSSN